MFAVGIKMSSWKNSVLLRGIENANRSILLAEVSRRPCSISTFSTSTSRLGRNVTADCRSAQSNVGSNCNDGGDVVRWYAWIWRDPFDQRKRILFVNKKLCGKGGRGLGVVVVVRC